MKIKKWLLFSVVGLLLQGNTYSEQDLFGKSEKCAPTSSVNRDEKGVWFIKSNSLNKAFEEMGYCVATDRLWQAELYRRSSRGTLSEVFGSSQLQTDILVRTMGYSEEELQEGFDTLQPKYQGIIKAYADGFNRRIDEIRSNPALLPFEFIAIGQQLGFNFIPEYWTPTDIIAWNALMARQFDAEAMSSGQIQNGALATELAQKFPSEYMQMFSDLRWLNDSKSQTMIPQKDHKHKPHHFTSEMHNYDNFQRVSKKIRHRIDNMKDRLKNINAYVKMGSYAWVLAANKTTTGNPILYSGPQMDFPTPSIVQEGSIDAPGYQVSGMTITGFPGIVIGRTPSHAWSMQVGHAHTVDFYVESPSAVQFHRMETIKVAGQDNITLPVFRTEHGPVVNPVPFNPENINPSDPILSWKYSHWKHELHAVEALFEMGAANSVKAFGKAIDKLPISMHVCYADNQKNIAYWMSGMDPVRPEGVDPRFPQIGDGSQEWASPLQLKPRAFDLNPKQGYFGGWNNKARKDYDNNCYYYNGIFTYGKFHRGHVVEEYLSKTKRLSFNQIRDLALNIASTDSFALGGNPWKFVSKVFTEAVMNNPDQDRTEVITLLEKWDGHFVEGGPSQWAAGTLRSDAWVLQNAWIMEVLRLTFEDELLTTTLNWTSQPPALLFNVFLHALEKENSGYVNLYDWFQDKSNSGKPATAEELIVLALDNVLDTLGARPWNVPRGEIIYTHALLGEVGRSPFSSRSTYAQCVEMDRCGPVRIESMFPLGQSGNISMDFQTGAPVFDQNFFSMKPEFDSFQPRKFPLFKGKNKSK